MQEDEGDADDGGDGGDCICAGGEHMPECQPPSGEKKPNGVEVAYSLSGILNGPSRVIGFYGNVLFFGYQRRRRHTKAKAAQPRSETDGSGISAPSRVIGRLT